MSRSLFSFAPSWFGTWKILCTAGKKIARPAMQYYFSFRAQACEVHSALQSSRFLAEEIAVCEAETSGLNNGRRPEACNPPKHEQMTWQKKAE